MALPRCDTWPHAVKTPIRFHFHLHVVPRHADDGIALSWPRKEPAAEVLRGYALQLGQALQAAG